jgi:hypothetical protein
MNLIALNDDYQLAIGAVGKKLRLMVFQAGVENVCRLETQKNLKKFAFSGDGRLFKGRLQLQKDLHAINVLVKEKTIGAINNERFIKLIDGITLPVSA